MKFRSVLCWLVGHHFLKGRKLSVPTRLSENLFSDDSLEFICRLEFSVEPQEIYNKNKTNKVPQQYLAASVTNEVGYVSIPQLEDSNRFFTIQRFLT